MFTLLLQYHRWLIILQVSWKKKWLITQSISPNVLQLRPAVSRCVCVFVCACACVCIYICMCTRKSILDLNPLLPGDVKGLAMIWIQTKHFVAETWDEKTYLSSLLTQTGEKETNLFLLNLFHNSRSHKTRWNEDLEWE